MPESIHAARVCVPIPLNGNNRYSDSYIRKVLRKLDPMSLFKPGRMLGAVWTDDKVALGKAVSMCGECVHKYQYWWRKYHYRGDWDWGYIADCDGCGVRNVRSTLFLPEAEFHNSLAPNHGRVTYANRRY